MSKKPTKPADWLDRPVSDLPLSVRSANCLDSAKITTIRQLTEADLGFMRKKVKNFGAKSAREVVAILRTIGLTMKGAEAVAAPVSDPREAALIELQSLAARLLRVYGEEVAAATMSKGKAALRHAKSKAHELGAVRAAVLAEEERARAGQDERQRKVSARRAQALAWRREGMTYVEIGERLNVNPGRAAELVRRAEREASLVDAEPSCVETDIEDA